MDELTLDRDHRRGDRGARVRVVQEWLTLHGIAVAIDGGFGPATEEAVRRFQARKRIVRDGVVGKRTYGALVAPMKRALAPIEPGRRSLGALVAAYARQHLRATPTEVGGQNAGPWVRLYMKGNQGPEWPWCAGFVCFLLEQACSALDAEPPIRPSFSCDSLAAGARERGVFLAEHRRGRDGTPRPGSFFLNRRTATDWTHTGIVLRARDESFDTIEGNTNDEGSREGYEVCQRVRGYAGKDFVVI
jgi:hypothetical protein